MPKLILARLAALAAVGALGAAGPGRAEPHDTLFVDPQAAQALAGRGEPAAPAPSADDLRSLAQGRAGSSSGGQFAGAVSLGSANPAIPHGQIPGVGAGAVLGSGGSVFTAGGLTTGSASTGGFGIGVSTALPGGPLSTVSLGGSGGSILAPPPPVLVPPRP
jgi:hypothetical protein